MNDSVVEGTCPLCKGPFEPWGRAKILGRHDAGYVRCRRCGYVRTEKPWWLDEAYGDAIAATDVGLVARNIELASLTRSLIRCLFNRRGSFIDYGGGYGLLARLLRDAGLDFRRHDPLCSNLFARGFDTSESGSCRYELLTAFEVFEHLVEPAEEIERMLRFSSNIFFSTLLLPEPPPRPGEWWYYCTETGQHVSLYTRASLETLASRHGLHFASDGRRLHLFSERPVSSALFRIATRVPAARLVNALTPARPLTEADYRAAGGHCGPR